MAVVLLQERLEVSASVPERSTGQRAAAGQKDQDPKRRRAAAFQAEPSQGSNPGRQSFGTRVSSNLL